MKCKSCEKDKIIGKEVGRGFLKRWECSECQDNRVSFTDLKEMQKASAYY